MSPLSGLHEIRNGHDNEESHSKPRECAQLAARRPHPRSGRRGRCWLRLSGARAGGAVTDPGRGSVTTYQKALESADVTPQRAHEWQAVAAVPEAVVEAGKG
jgi:hypothetical protein